MSSDHEDYLLAVRLQREFNNEFLSDDEFDDEPTEFRDKLPITKRKWTNEANQDLNNTCNLVHPEWETLDPTPDVHSMFLAFDNKFFQGRLKCVCLEWSKRMYSCAGICYSTRSRMGMSVIIRLSEPLLKLRSRKDLVETLLHEMIHAYCFVLNIREGNGGHGPVFKKIMYGINQVAGTNITVYHTFHDEVDLYKVHWWRCNGICQNRKPFFGYVKRTSNRAPGPNDNWWRQHMISCGGYFLKIKEPDSKPKPKSKPIYKIAKESEENSNQIDLRTYFGLKSKDEFLKPKNVAPTFIKPTIIPREMQIFVAPTKNNNNNNGGGGTYISPPSRVNTPPPILISSTPLKFNSSTLGGGNLTNVVGLKNLGESNMEKTTDSNYEMNGKGYFLNIKDLPSTSSSITSPVNVHKIRDLWASKYNSSIDRPKTGQTSTSSTIIDIGLPPKGSDMWPSNFSSITDRNLASTSSSASTIHIRGSPPNIHESDPRNEAKKRRLLSNNDWKTSNHSQNEESDVIVLDEIPDLICLSSDEENIEPHVSSTTDTYKIKKQTAQERQNQIKQEIMDVTNLHADDIMLIDDDYDDALSACTTDITAADTSLVDDLFGEDTLLRAFRLENSVVPCSSRYQHNPRDDIVSCPICQERLKREHFEEHLNGCVGISNKIDRNAKSSETIAANKKNELEFASVLKKAGYSESEIINILSEHNNTPTSMEGGNSSSSRNRNNELESPASPPPEEYLADDDDDPELSNSLADTRRRTTLLSTAMHNCPICQKRVKANEINEHLDLCLLDD